MTELSFKTSIKLNSLQLLKHKKGLLVGVSLFYIKLIVSYSFAFSKAAFLASLLLIVSAITGVAMNKEE